VFFRKTPALFSPQERPLGEPFFPRFGCPKRDGSQVQIRTLSIWILQFFSNQLLLRLVSPRYFILLLAFAEDFSRIFSPEPSPSVPISPSAPTPLSFSRESKSFILLTLLSFRKTGDFTLSRGFFNFRPNCYSYLTGPPYLLMTPPFLRRRIFSFFPSQVMTRRYSNLSNGSHLLFSPRFCC